MSKKFGKGGRPGAGPLGGHGGNSFRMNDKPMEGPPVELENQFILKLPPEPAIALREAIRSGASNLKERLFIQLEPDKASNNQYLRAGHVQFDGWNFTSKLVDMPTILETHKTIDSKTMYKTADISQMLICKEGEDSQEEEEVNSPLRKKKDPNKVDKKFLWPHGMAPPLKNCRKRRFRKTLRKKYVEAPEIEKEVKRLLRVDNEAVSVKWEVITEEELLANKGGEAGKDNPAVKPSAFGGFTNDPSDLGLELSDSDEERDNQDDSMTQDRGGDKGDDMDSEGDSRMSEGGDSRMSDSNISGRESQREGGDKSLLSSPLKSAGSGSGQGHHPTQFSKDMFNSPASSAESPGRMTRQEQLQQQRVEMMHLASKKRELEHNIANCPNEALRNRFKQELQGVSTEIKRLETSGF